VNDQAEPLSSGPARAITILGMHRSGTSMLIGTLKEAGVFLGNVYGDPIEHNKKGLHEPKAVLFMHEDLFKANGGAWNNPPPRVEWKDLHLAVRDLFIESRLGQALWAFKDPRTLFALDGWRSAMPHLELVGIFRHPLEVAASIQRRNGFPLEQALDLWRRYNERLLQIHRNSPFPIIEFHRSPEELRAKLSALLEVLHLPRVPQPAELSFFEEGIRQHDVLDRSVPDQVRDIYQQLQDIAL
jgi:hypothetical protein